MYGVKLRHEQPDTYRDILQSSGLLARHAQLIELIGGTSDFERGLYGCSEMLVDGFIDLYRAGILKRHVYPHALLQQLINEGLIGEEVNKSTLQALIDAGLGMLTPQDFSQLQLAGVIREKVSYQCEMANLAPFLGTRLKTVCSLMGIFLRAQVILRSVARYARTRASPIRDAAHSFINERMARSSTQDRAASPRAVH